MLLLESVLEVVLEAVGNSESEDKSGMKYIFFLCKIYPGRFLVLFPVPGQSGLQDEPTKKVNYYFKQTIALALIPQLPSDTESIPPSREQNTGPRPKARAPSDKGLSCRNDFPQGQCR